MTEYFICPACKNKAALKHEVNLAGRTQLFFGCKSCRHHFQVLRMDGFRDKIVAESPREVNSLSDLGQIKLRMGCPTCGNYGLVQSSVNRQDGYWRRHMCSTCGPYYTCQTVHGVTVHQRQKAFKTIDVEDVA